MTNFDEDEQLTRRAFLARAGAAGLLTMAAGCGGSVRDSLPSVGSRTVDNPFGLSGKTIFVEVGSIAGGQAVSKDTPLMVNFANQSVSNTNLVKNATVKLAFKTQAVVVVPPGATLPQTITLDTFAVGGAATQAFELRELDGANVTRRAALPDLSLTGGKPILTRAVGNAYTFDSAPTLQTRLNSSQSRAALAIVTGGSNANQLAYAPRFTATSSPTLPPGTRIFLVFAENSLRVEF